MLPVEHNLEFLSLKEAAQAGLSLHKSKCHFFGNNMSQLMISKFQQCGILTSVDSDEPVQPPFNFNLNRNPR